MAEQPGMITGGRMTRGETSGDRRNLGAAKQPRGAILLRLWRYLGKNRLLLALAIVLIIITVVRAVYGKAKMSR